jgi:hypothetical protein
MNSCPWPEGEKSKTPTGKRTPEQWYRELDTPVQRQVATILLALDAAGRQRFHDERREIAKTLPEEHNRFFKERSVSAREKFLAKWAQPSRF